MEKGPEVGCGRWSIIRGATPCGSRLRCRAGGARPLGVMKGSVGKGDPMQIKNETLIGI